ncbi:hypothetical protein M0657_011648 [Pyricularia oryzae]|nr:hypothetical protein M9X92_011623 [Pyricularia oryzae]KAI7909859.1 hypothetical protein M0657_011648 [Pyricularia oryzae]
MQFQYNFIALTAVLQVLPALGATGSSRSDEYWVSFFQYKANGERDPIYVDHSPANSLVIFTHNERRLNVQLDQHCRTLYPHDIRKQLVEGYGVHTHKLHASSFLSTRSPPPGALQNLEALDGRTLKASNGRQVINIIAAPARTGPNTNSPTARSKAASWSTSTKCAARTPKCLSESTI